MKQNIYYLILPLMAIAIFLSACKEQDEFLLMKRTTYKMRLNASIVSYGGQDTRSSAYTFVDKDKLYVLFHQGNSNIRGTAVYDGATGIWTITASSALSETEAGSCKIAFFLSEAGSTETEIALTQQTRIYTDADAKYQMYDGLLTVQTKLSPALGRIRFKGTQGQQCTVSGLAFGSAFDLRTHTFALTPGKITATCAADGYTPYYYCNFADLQTRQLTFELTPSKELYRSFGEAVLQAGTSGYITIPTIGSHDGWTLIDNSGGGSSGSMAAEDIQMVSDSKTVSYLEITMDESLSEQVVAAAAVLTLPEGITINEVWNEGKGKDVYDVEFPNVTPSFNTNVVQGQTNIYTLASMSTSSFFKTSTNVLFKVGLVAAETVEAGEYEIWIDPSFSNSDGESVFPQDPFAVKVTVKSGDNSDNDTPVEGNTLYIKKFSVNAGETVDVPIRMHNIEPIAGVSIQFTSEYEGITFNTSVNKLTMCTERLDIETALIALGEDPNDSDYEAKDLFGFWSDKGLITFNATLASGYTDGEGNWHSVCFLGNDGPLFKIPLTVSNTVANGTYTIEFSQSLANGEYISQSVASSSIGSFVLTVGKGTSGNVVNINRDGWNSDDDWSDAPNTSVDVHRDTYPGDEDWSDAPKTSVGVTRDTYPGDENWN